MLPLKITYMFKKFVQEVRYSSLLSLPEPHVIVGVKLVLPVWQVYS